MGEMMDRLIVLLLVAVHPSWTKSTPDESCGYQVTTLYGELLVEVAFYDVIALEIEKENVIYLSLK